MSTPIGNSSPECETGIFLSLTWVPPIWDLHRFYHTNSNAAMFSTTDSSETPMTTPRNQGPLLSVQFRDVKPWLRELRSGLALGPRTQPESGVMPAKFGRDKRHHQVCSDHSWSRRGSDVRHSPPGATPVLSPIHTTPMFKPHEFQRGIQCASWHAGLRPRRCQALNEYLPLCNIPMS